MDNLKICSICKKSKSSSDFLFNNESCYKCVYEMKVKTKVRRGKKCRICRKDVPAEKTFYCSDECAAVSKKDRRHWTANFRSENTWKRKTFNFSSTEAYPCNED